MRGLLLDIGGVVIRTPFELFAATEQRLGLPDGALGPPGPFAVDDDPDFRRVLDGSTTERAYWADRAAHVAPLLGTTPDTRAFMQAVFDLPADDVVRPEVARLVADAALAGLRVGLLTNDVSDFHGPGWIEELPVFAHVDVLVDGSVTGVLKPDPGAFALGVEAMALPPEDVVFVDDQPVNVAGAIRSGLRTVRFDITDPAGSVHHVRSLLGLP